MRKRAFCEATLWLAAVLSIPACAQSLDAITLPQRGRSMRASSGNPHDNADSAKFAIGETRTIAHLQGPGKIAHIWLVPSSMDIRYPRALVLRIYWDGSDVPSVETPLGDFFAVGNGMQATVDSLPVKVSSYGRGYNCYWQMPFNKEAKVTLSNESDKARASCYYQIDWVQYDQPADGANVLPRSIPPGVSARAGPALYGVHRPGQGTLCGHGPLIAECDRPLVWRR